jgi:hypothetical protein
MQCLMRGEVTCDLPMAAKPQMKYTLLAWYMLGKMLAECNGVRSVGGSQVIPEPKCAGRTK